ncbi:chain length determinant protein [Micrococcus porci]|uniref:polysaccharide biosynthesis tyrosine autokinase n=1 Tax=Micrococcus porci TaxID=2856555 RepID=UPI001CCB7C6F|nr:polysaccharide biosynthesis tyrosine autokinase [Micrococcus porci]UBH24467.1 chain length determinant protein [Micrococcus porci]
MNILDFLRVLRANRLVLLGGVVLGLLGGLVYSLLQPTLYTSTSTGFVTVAGEASISGTETALTRAQSYVPLINSRTVREKVAESGVDVSGSTLSAQVVPNSNLITVTALAPDPQRAADLANTALGATAEVANSLDPTSNVKVTAMEDALPPAGPSSPDHLRNALIGAGIGLLAALAVAFLRRVLDVNVRTTTDATEASGAGLLGAIPQDGTMKAERTAPLGVPSPRAAEALRQLRTNLRFAAVDDPPRVVMVTSSNPGEGKSTVIAGLAQAVAVSGQPVILVDADLRRPRQASQFGVDGRVGLSEVLSGDVLLEDAVQDLGDGLLLLPAGRTPPNPSEQLGSHRMQELLRVLAETHLVLVDAPPGAAGDGLHPAGGRRGRDRAGGAPRQDPEGPCGGGPGHAGQGQRPHAGRGAQRRARLRCGLGLLRRGLRRGRRQLRRLLPGAPGRRRRRGRDRGRHVATLIAPGGRARSSHRRRRPGDAEGPRL